MMVRLINTRPTLVGLPDVPGFESRRMLPGGNDLEAAHLNALLEHRGFKKHIDLGWFELGRDEDVGKPEGPTPPANVSDRSLEAAQLLVRMEHDPHVLTAWAAADRRQPVKDAVAQRLKALGV